MKKSSGFSLIEVALALLVVSVGLVAAVGMLPGSLNNSKRATDDTQQSLFADYVLNTLRAYAVNTNFAWSTIGPGLQVQVAAPDMWDNPGSMLIPVSAAGATTPTTLVFKPSKDNKIEEMTMSCILTIDSTKPGPNMKLAMLKIAPVPAAAFNNVTGGVYYAVLQRGDAR